VIAFDNLDKNASFHGISKLVFDMPRNDLTFLHERLANSWLRQLGILSPCSNSARLVVNDTYYGLYVSEEDIGHRLVKEYFPDNPNGDLFKGGYTPETNAATPNWPRLQQFWDAKTVADMAPVVDLATSVREGGRGHAERRRRVLGRRSTSSSTTKGPRGTSGFRRTSTRRSIG
jgi:spore coat protein CotH